MSNLHDLAYDLEKAIRESDEYQSLKQAYAAVNEDETAKKMFDNFRQLQLELQQKQMQGEQISQEEAQKAQQQLELVQQQPTISELMNAEQRMSTLVTDMNKIITKPLEDLYGTPENEQ